ncbi:MAG: DUF3320 domain-containing protein [Clostridiales bacterium]|nr:DUF3320 domain-containing protein [Clostridiales bacterium]
MPPFTAAEFTDPVNLSVLEGAAKALIEAEAPIGLNTFTDRLCEACGIKRKTEPIRKRCEYLYKRFGFPVTIQNISAGKSPDWDRIIIWKSTSEVGKLLPYYRVPEVPSDLRDPQEVPVQEAACAAVYIAKSQYGMPRDALIIETGRALGFPTSTPTVKLLCAAAIDLAIAEGELSEGDRLIRP